MAEAYGKLTGAPGTIRLHQERTYPGRAYGTDLKNPDFVAFAHLFNRNINAVLPN
jgi:acetolactate synthase I/II/III large subunit